MKQAIHHSSVPGFLVQLICGMHPHLKQKVRAGLQAILDDPNSGKTLWDELEGLKSYRIRTFRLFTAFPAKRPLKLWLLALGKASMKRLTGL